MRDGLYKAAFRTPLGEGTGVVYLHKGEIHGGDATQYYIGSYFFDSDRLSAEIKSLNYSKYPGVTSVFGGDTANIKLAGSFSNDSAQCVGTAREFPGLRFETILTRIAD